MGEHILENLPQTYALIVLTIAGVSAIIVALERADKKKRQSRRHRGGNRNEKNFNHRKSR